MECRVSCHHELGEEQMGLLFPSHAQFVWEVVQILKKDCVMTREEAYLVHHNLMVDALGVH